MASNFCREKDQFARIRSLPGGRLTIDLEWVRPGLLGASGPGTGALKALGPFAARIGSGGHPRPIEAIRGRRARPRLTRSLVCGRAMGFGHSRTSARTPNGDLGNTKIDRSHGRGRRPAHMGNIDDSVDPCREAVQPDSRRPIRSRSARHRRPLKRIDRPPVVRLARPCKATAADVYPFAACRRARSATSRTSAAAWTGNAQLNPRPASLLVLLRRRRQADMVGHSLAANDSLVRLHPGVGVESSV
jgi:hypothetical protein